MRDNKQITKIVAACLLGDGYVTKVKNGLGQFQMQQKEEHKDHLDYVANYLDDVTKVHYYNLPSRKVCTNGYESMSSPSIRICSNKHSFFAKFRERMYGTGKKTVDNHYLTLLDWEFLALWYMQDGSFSFNKENNVEAVVIYSDCFSYADNLLLKDSLEEKLGIIWNVHKRVTRSGLYAYHLYLYKKCLDEFFNGIYKYMQPSFNYKLSIERLTPMQNGMVI